MRSDPVEISLLALARASYPHLYERQGEPEILRAMGGFVPGIGISRHSAEHEDVLKALANDPQLRLFYESEDEGVGVFISASTGSGWRVQGTNLPMRLLGSAALQVVVKGRSLESVDPLLEEVVGVVTSFRALLNGDADEAIALTGFEGFSLPPEHRLPTAFGELRAAGEIEQSFRPGGNPAASTVLATTIPVTFVVGEPSVDPADRSQDEGTMKRVGETGGLVALSLLLASEGDLRIANAVWQTTVIPGEGVSGFTTRLPRPRFFEEPVPEPLGAIDTRRLSEWAARVHKHYDESIQIAVTRTRSAVGERNDPQDAVIDAVVAWENLFGAADSKAEVTFRVTTALARLLENNPTRRAEFRSELTDVYNVRSRVIHGDEVRAKDKLAERSALAIDVAVRALRVLFAERPELIPDRHRALNILLERN